MLYFAGCVVRVGSSRCGPSPRHTIFVPLHSATHRIVATPYNHAPIAHCFYRPIRHSPRNTLFPSPLLPQGVSSYLPTNTFDLSTASPSTFGAGDGYVAECYRGSVRSWSGDCCLSSCILPHSNATNNIFFRLELTILLSNGCFCLLLL